MKPLMTAAHRLAHAMHVVSGALLILMVLTVLVDIITRTVFGATEGAVDLTFPGSVEIVSFGLLYMVLFSLPYSVSRGQVIVDLFTEGLSDRMKEVLEAIYTIGFGLLGVGMAIRYFEAIGRSADSGETSQDLLIPLEYIYAITAFAAAVLAIRGLLVALEQIIAAGRQK
ncbi:MAG: TRAP transporter small permease [Magnetospiraceae bacterium]